MNSDSLKRHTIVSSAIPSTSRHQEVWEQLFQCSNNTTGGPSGSDDLSSEDASDVLRILHQHLVDHMRNPPSLNVTLLLPHFTGLVWKNVIRSARNVTHNKRHIWIREWQERFLKYEKELLGRMKALSYWITRSGITNIDSRIPGIANDLNNALFMAFDRWDQKVKKLEELNNRINRIIRYSVWRS